MQTQHVASFLPKVLNSSLEQRAATLKVFDLQLQSAHPFVDDMS
jgi:hypothetical protein